VFPVLLGDSEEKNPFGVSRIQPQAGRSKAIMKKEFTIILLSKECPDLLCPLLWGVFIIWKVLHILRIDHFENSLYQIKITC
jgi:hypothetical protein